MDNSVNALGWVNVKDSPFSAKGVGTNDTTSIQNAINSITQGTVYIPDGVYIVNTINLKSNMKLLLSPNAILKAAIATNNENPMILLNGVVNAVIEGGIIDGDNQGFLMWESGLIRLYGSSDCIIKQVKIKNAVTTTAGIHINKNCVNCEVTNCNILNTNMGIWVIYSQKINIHDNIIERTIAPTDGNTSQIIGVHVDNSSDVLIHNNITKEFDIGIETWGEVYDCVIANNVITSPWGISCDRTYRTTVTGNKIYSSIKTTLFQYGIELAQGRYMTVSANVIYINNTITSGYRWGIATISSGGNATNYSDNCTISDNIVYGANVGLVIGNSTNMMYTNNLFSNILFRGIYFFESTGTGTDIANIVIHNNTIIANGIFTSEIDNNGIFMYASHATYVKISDNHIEKFNDGMHFRENVSESDIVTNPSTKIIVSNNEIFSCLGRGIYSSKVADLDLSNNKIYDTQAEGIYYYGASNNSFYFNAKANVIRNSCISSGIAGLYVDSTKLGTKFCIEDNRIIDTMMSKPYMKIEGSLDVNINRVVRNNSNGFNELPSIYYGSVVPTGNPFRIGDICYNTNPVRAGFIGWVYVGAQGWDGTWKTFGLISN